MSGFRRRLMMLPSEEDVYVLNNAVLLSDGTVLLADDGIPVMYGQAETDTSHDYLGVMLLDGTVVPYSRVPEQGYSREQVVGISYSNGGHEFAVALDDIENVYFCAGGEIVEDPSGVVVTSTVGVARQDYSGEQNTTVISSLLADFYAVNRAKNYTFPNGENGYLGAMGEYNLILGNIDLVNELAAKCGGTPIPTTKNYWSSTLNFFDIDGNTRWVWIWRGDGYVDGGNGQDVYNVRPLLKTGE